MFLVPQRGWLSLKTAPRSARSRKSSSPPRFQSENGGVSCLRGAIGRRQFLRDAALIATAPLLLPLATPRPHCAVAAACIDAGITEARATDRVFLDLSVAGVSSTTPLRLVIGLYGEAAPQAVFVVRQLFRNALRIEGKRLGYRYAAAGRVIRDQRVELGRVSQADERTQALGVASRTVKAVWPGTVDTNPLRHRCAGTVSVPRQPGGDFELGILPRDVADANAPYVRALDDDHLVIGRVLDGMDVVERLNQLPVNLPTKRDGLREVGKMLGDPRARQSTTWRPLRKVRIVDCGVLNE